MESFTDRPSIDGDSVQQAPVVRFDRASVSLGGASIWHNVCFDVRAGQFIAILGPNGAGKSTLLRVMLGLLPPNEGQVTVLGRSPRRGNRDIGYLPQRRVFDTDMRIRGRDLVRLGIEGTRWGVPLPGLRRFWGGDRRAREEKRQVAQVIELVNAAAYADRPIGEISGGEQQRLLIAQALVTRPQLLLLDEPLDGLDLPNQQAVAAIIQRISRDQGVTVLMVAHDINSILPYVDRVIYVARGQAIIGTPVEVITSETLSHLYDAPIEVLRARDGRLLVVGVPEVASHHAVLQSAH